MRDLIIKSNRIKKELQIFSSCFSVSFIINVYAIISFQTPWHEVFTQLGYVVTITVSLYLLLAVMRVIISLIRKIVV